MDLSKIEYLGLDRVLRRGSGELVAELPEACLVHDRVSGAWMLACEAMEPGLSLLERHVGPDCALLMVSHAPLGALAFERYGFSERLHCVQVAWFGEKPAPEAALTVETARREDLPLLIEHYDLVSPEELEQLVERGSILLGYYQGTPVGFVGEHLEGSMGLLYVLPAFRRRGFGAALEKAFIARTMERGFIPFGQVETHNEASLRLQKRLGLRCSDRPMLWMWK